MSATGVPSIRTKERHSSGHTVPSHFQSVIVRVHAPPPPTLHDLTLLAYALRGHQRTTFAWGPFPETPTDVVEWCRVKYWRAYTVVHTGQPMGWHQKTNLMNVHRTRDFSMLRLATKRLWEVALPEWLLWRLEDWKELATESQMPLRFAYADTQGFHGCPLESVCEVVPHTEALIQEIGSYIGRVLSASSEADAKAFAARAGGVAERVRRHLALRRDLEHLFHTRMMRGEWLWKRGA
mgnify:CR=1 FL=1